jgi:esterase/lipase superfamily enzyme
MPVSFFTNRNLAPKEIRTAQGHPFGDERGDTVRFGLCEVRFLSIPGVERLTDAVPFHLPSEIKRINSIREVEEGDFWRRFSDTLTVGPGHKTVIYVHGFKISLEKGCRRVAAFKREVDLGDNVILFSWPSNGSLLNYAHDEEDLAWSVTDIETMLRAVVERVGPGNVNLVGHSLGGRGVVQALTQFDWPRGRPRPFDQVVLLAPDVDTGIFRKQFPKLRRLAGRVTLYAFGGDNALKLSRQIHGYPRLGEAGPDLTVLEGLETIDLSPTGSYEISGHLYHQHNPYVIADIRRLLKIGDGADNRPGLSTVRRDGMRYWSLVPPALGPSGVAAGE